MIALVQIVVHCFLASVAGGFFSDGDTSRSKANFVNSGFGASEKMSAGILCNSIVTPILPGASNVYS